MEETNYIELESKVAHCPSCNKPVMNSGHFFSPVAFAIRCPWCKANVRVFVQIKVFTEIIQKEVMERSL